MPDQASGRERQAAEEAAAARRRDRDDWFARQLGDEWQAAEPGVYRRATSQQPTEEPAPTESLDESMLERLPSQEETPAPPEQQDVARGRRTSSRGWWRSR